MSRTPTRRPRSCRLRCSRSRASAPTRSWRSTTSTGLGSGSTRSRASACRPARRTSAPSARPSWVSSTRGSRRWPRARCLLLAGRRRMPEAQGRPPRLPQRRVAVFAVRSTPRGTLQRAPDRRRLRSRTDGGVPVPDRRRRYDRRLRVPRNPRSRRVRDDRHARRGAARALRAAASDEGPVGRKGRELGVPRDARARCRAPHRPPSRRAGPRRALRDRRHGRDARVREGAARDRWHAAKAAFRRRRRRLLPHARRLPPPSRARPRRAARRRDRRWVHRLGDHCRARDERMRRDDRLPGRRDRRASLPCRPRGVRQRLLPREGRHGSRGSSSSRRSHRVS